MNLFLILHDSMAMVEAPGGGPPGGGRPPDKTRKRPHPEDDPATAQELEEQLQEQQHLYGAFVDGLTESHTRYSEIVSTISQIEKRMIERPHLRDSELGKHLEQLRKFQTEEIADMTRIKAAIRSKNQQIYSLSNRLRSKGIDVPPPEPPPPIVYAYIPRPPVVPRGVGLEHLRQLKRRASHYTPSYQVGGALTSRETEKFVKASYKKKSDAHDVDGYHLDTSLSSKKNKVYVNPEGKVVVANAGTSSMSDWKNNPSIAFGSYKKTKRYKQGEKIQKKAIEKYGLDNITNVSHSQSGEMNRIFAKKGLTKNAIAVNPALIGKKGGKNVHVVRSSTDVVSAFAKGPKTTIKAKTYNPLAEHGAEVLSREPKKTYGKGLWIDHVKETQQKHGVSYKEAMKLAKHTYRKQE